MRKTPTWCSKTRLKKASWGWRQQSLGTQLTRSHLSTRTRFTCQTRASTLRSTSRTQTLFQLKAVKHQHILKFPSSQFNKASMFPVCLLPIKKVTSKHPDNWIQSSIQNITLLQTLILCLHSLTWISITLLCKATLTNKTLKTVHLLQSLQTT